MICRGLMHHPLIAQEFSFIIKHRIQPPRMVNTAQTHLFLLPTALCQPSPKRYTLRPLQHITKIQHRFFLAWHRIHNLLIQPSRFHHLLIRITCKTLLAHLRHKPFCPKRCHQRRTHPHTILRHR